MEKKYQVLTLEIEKSGNLNLDKLSEMEKTKVLENRDIIYVYFGKKDLYIGQTIDLLQRHQQHKLEIEFKMKNYTNLVLLYGTLIDKHLDYIEKSLINLFIADNDKGKDLKNKRTIRNKTMGNHSNYTTLEKDIDAKVITPFWENELNKLKKNPYINQKLNSFPKLRRLFEEEPYLYNFHPHSTTKVELDKIIANINREIKKELIGLKFLKTLSKKSYIPASIEDRKASEITAEERKRIICILEKKSSEKDYSKILFRNLEENLSLYIPKEIFISIKKELEKVNYNCLTGEPINIQNHSSGENKWIGKKDVERLEIEKKDDVKEKIGKIAVMMTEKEMEDYKKNRGMETKEITNPSNEKKLYIIPVPYYNISDLKITKEIEQKFVPMKENKKAQEIEKSKGQGIGD